MDKTVEKLERELRDLAAQISEADDDAKELREERGERMREAVEAGVKKKIVAEWAGVDPVVVSRNVK